MPCTCSRVIRALAPPSDRAEARAQQKTAPDDLGPRRSLSRSSSRLANENRTWGSRRIQGALANPGHNIGRFTNPEVRARNGIDPAPDRERKTTWKALLEQRYELIVAADFFTIEAWTREAWTRRGLERFVLHRKNLRQSPAHDLMLVSAHHPNRNQQLPFFRSLHMYGRISR